MLADISWIETLCRERGMSQPRLRGFVCLWGSLHVCTHLHTCVFTWVGACAVTEGLCACVRECLGYQGPVHPHCPAPDCEHSPHPGMDSDDWCGERGLEGLNGGSAPPPLWESWHLWGLEQGVGGWGWTYRGARRRIRPGGVSRERGREQRGRDPGKGVVVLGGRGSGDTPEVVRGIQPDCPHPRLSPLLHPHWPVMLGPLWTNGNVQGLNSRGTHRRSF